MDQLNDEQRWCSPGGGAGGSETAVARSGRVDQRDAAIARDLAALATGLGYRPSLELEISRTSSCAWWFHRSGTEWTTELLLFELYRRPRAMLTTTFFGALLPIAQLVARGADGNVAGWNPFDYLFDGLKVPFSELSGDVIYLKPESEWPRHFAALSRDLHRAHPSIWADLWASHQRNVARGIDHPLGR